MCSFLLCPESWSSALVERVNKELMCLARNLGGLVPEEWPSLLLPHTPSLLFIHLPSSRAICRDLERFTVTNGFLYKDYFYTFFSKRKL